MEQLKFWIVLRDPVDHSLKNVVTVTHLREADAIEEAERLVRTTGKKFFVLESSWMIQPMASPTERVQL